jgi:hypothetical protein
MNLGQLKEWRLPLLMLVACVVVLLAVAQDLYAAAPAGVSIPSSPGPPTSVVVLNAGLSISYWTSNPNDTAYLIGPECDQLGPPVSVCPINFTAGATWDFVFQLNNSDSVNHTLSNVTIDAPFTLESATPALPFSLPSGVAVKVSLELQVPATDGLYFLNGVLGTS